MTYEDTFITLNIREYMDYGLRVFDRDSKQVGTVFDYDGTFGYMTVRPHPLSNRLLHIPFGAVTHIDPREVFIEKTREEAHRLYRDPPSRSTMLEERRDPITDEDDSVAVTIEPSGYDGSPIIVDKAAVGRMAHHIARGFRVLSSEVEDLGTVRELDQTLGQMLVKSSQLPRRVQMIPIAFVDFVDREDRLVYLAVSAADLRRLPAVSVVHEDGAVLQADIIEP